MFNPQARWDRHLPSDSHEEEAIEVGAIFRNGKMFPKWFLWKDRRYSIKEVTYEWQDKRGTEVLFFFAVSDGTNIFQIYFNNRFVHWRLTKVLPPE